MYRPFRVNEQESPLNVWRLVSMIVFSLLIVFFSSCKAKDKSPAQSLYDFIHSGMIFAVEDGDIYGVIAKEIFNAQNVIEYTTVDEMFEAIHRGEVDAILISEGFTSQLQHSGLYPDLEYLLIPKETYTNKAAPIFYTKELRDKYNEWFAQAKADSVWDEVVNRWLHTPLPASQDIPQFEFTGENGILRIVDTGNYPPLSYFSPDGKLVGFDPDMASRFALYMNMKPEFIILPYEEAAQAVMTGKADMSACTYAISAEREKEMIFGEPSVITQAVLVVRK